MRAHRLGGLRVADACLPLLVCCIGCGPGSEDSDRDGLTDAFERTNVGSDPHDPDTDGDGLNDGDDLALGGSPLDTDTDDDGLDDFTEAELGTALHDADSDGDSYTDRDEIHELSDPLDPTSKIYVGGWPYAFEKFELKGGTTYEVGKRFANFQLVDQFGDVVSLWDFHNEDRYVLVDVCAGWLYTCKELSQWLAGGANVWLDPWSPVRDAVDAGELYWITFLSEGIEKIDGTPQATTAEDVDRWADSFPHEHVPVLQDTAAESYAYLELWSLPALVLLEPNLKVHTDGVGDYTAALDATLEILGR